MYYILKMVSYYRLSSQISPFAYLNSVDEEEYMRRYPHSFLNTDGSYSNTQKKDEVSKRVNMTMQKKIAFIHIEIYFRRRCFSRYYPSW